MPAGEFSWEESEDRLVIDAVRACVTFLRHDDRWTHEIVFLDEPGATASVGASWLVRSQECDPNHADPEPHRQPRLPGDPPA